MALSSVLKTSELWLGDKKGILPGPLYNMHLKSFKAQDILKIHISAAWKENCSSLVWMGREALCFHRFGVLSPLTTFPTLLGTSVFSAQTLTPHSELPPCLEQCWHSFQTPSFPLLTVEHSKLLWGLKLTSHKCTYSQRQTSLGWFFADQNTAPSDTEQGLKETKQRAISNLLAQCYFPKSQVVSTFPGSNTIILHQKVCS